MLQSYAFHCIHIYVCIIYVCLLEGFLLGMMLFRFWLAVQDLKRRPLQEVSSRAHEIWQEFLAEGAPSAINLDSHSYERTSQNLKDPGRYSFEDAQVSCVGSSSRMGSHGLYAFTLAWAQHSHMSE